jgi:hypothetical protein
MTEREFEEWIQREMPAGTVISDPLWWAPRILKAARATPALPQGVEEWIAANSEYADKVYERHAKFQSVKKYVAVDDLMKLLSGMAIVPVEPTEKMTLAAMLAVDRRMPYINDAQKVRAIWLAMLAAAKEKNNE